MSSSNTSIEWTDRTWNPVRGCSLVSPGCTNCYAMKFAHRFSGEGKPYEGLTRQRKRLGPVWSGNIRLVPEALVEPVLWRKPARIFVNSMSDLFHEEVPDTFIAAVFGVMSYARRHTFQVLTKRADRMVRWHEWLAAEAPAAKARWVAAVAEAEQLCGEEVGSRGAARNDGRERVVSECADRHVIERRGAHISAYYPGWPPPNVHLGVSVEDRRHGLPRVDALREVPAALRFLSIEPLLEDLGEIDLTGIGWVIVGGESGPGARPCNVAWIRRIVAQCRAQSVPVFVKQLGAVVIDRNDAGFSDEFPEAWPCIDPDAVEHDLDGTRDGYQGAPVRVHLRHAKGADPTEWPRDLREQAFPRGVR